VVNLLTKVPLFEDGGDALRELLEHRVRQVD
jgi:hypothetical protein